MTSNLLLLWCTNYYRTLKLKYYDKMRGILQLVDVVTQSSKIFELTFDIRSSISLQINFTITVSCFLWICRPLAFDCVRYKRTGRSGWDIWRIRISFRIQKGGGCYNDKWTIYCICGKMSFMTLVILLKYVLINLIHAKLLEDMHVRQWNNQLFYK